MSKLEQNIPNDFWRKTFEDAAETPPPRVWDAVERRLDDNEPRVLPLWGAGLVSSRPFVWSVGVAAAVALLLIGWWALRTTPPVNPVARRQPSGQVERVAVIPSAPDNVATNPSLEPASKRLPAPDRQAQETVASNLKSTSLPRRQVTRLPVQPARQPAAESVTQVTPAPTTATVDLNGKQRVADEQPVRTVQRAVASSTHTDVLSNSRMALTGSATAPTTFPNTVVSATPMSIVAGQAPSFDPLRALAIQLREPGSIQRIVWFRPAEPAVEPATVQPKRETREMWASVSLMPGAFSPSVAVRSAQPSFAKANTNALNNVGTTQPSVNSRANFSVAYQAGAGIQLSERWSVESGVGYLSGRSTVESPVQTSAANFQAVGIAPSGQIANLYVDALRNRVASPSSAANNSIAGSFYDAAATSRFTAQNNYNPQTRQSLSNDYQFVQVPVQVGYQLRPRKRLSLALLGGFLSNIFVRNTVADDLVITAKDGVYRPVSWAATVGARFRYRPSRQWSASLAGVYQPSLGPNTKPEAAVQSRPTSTGLSFGIDYHF